MFSKTLIISRDEITLKTRKCYTGKSFSEALILASANPQYDKRLFMELSTMNNLLTYCGLIDAKLRASDKDLPVHVTKGVSDLEI